MIFEDLTNWIGWIGYVFAAFVIGMSLTILGIYSRNGYRRHVALMALSYSIMSVLLVATINFKIFYEGTSRFVGAILFLAAAIFGAAGLLLMFRRMKQQSSGQVELVEPVPVKVVEK